GAFDAGVYRVFDYGGTLTDNGLALGTMPVGSNTIVQTSVAGQVNLVNSAGLTLNFWDGTDGIRNNGAIEGGNGVWQNSAGDDSWTEATGAVNAAYADGAFAIFSGTGGTVTVDNSLGAVTASGMQFTADGYAIGGDELTLVGAQSVIRVGDGSTAGADMTATIGAVLTGDAQLVKTDPGTLVLAGANSYTGGTAVQGGTLVVSADANLGDAAGNVTLDGGTLRTTADFTSDRSVALAGDSTILTDADTRFTLNGGLSGTGVLTKAGAGTLVLTGDNAGYTAGGLVTGGTLAVDGIFGGNVDVASGGRLEGNGSVANIVNAGVVAPGRGIGTLTVAGDYVGAGGALEIEAVLGGDGSATDRLVVGGGTFGTTRVTVINRDGLGAPTVEGIRIIDVAGASDGSFVLNGDYMFQGEQAVIAGAYGYRLYKNGVADPQDGDWYLRSSLLNPPVDPVDPEEPGEPGGPDEPEQPQPLYQPGVPVYEGYAQTLQALNGLPTLQQRVGNRAWANVATPDGIGIWGRMDASRQRPEALVSTSGADQNIDSWQMQMGLDAVLGQRSDGATLIGGITAHYGEADNSIASIFGNGKIDTQGYGLGATLTWYGPEGFYTDAQAKFSWFDSDLKSDTLGTLVKGNDGRGQAFSLEVGKRSPVGNKLTLTPQIQMIYAHVGFDSFADPAGAQVSAARGDSLKSRWGLSIDRQNSWDSAGGTRRSHVYGLVNLSYEWLDGAQVDVSGTPIASRNRRLWGELGLGGSYSWGNGRYTLYTEVSGDTPIADFGKGYSLKGNAGLRIQF
ncbi:MAG TPA: autotransporter outer membrane beta-barrel domain-containing protein, partial [Croceibacterium sp.]|nr:autotransporter outer membrane beta-barrel domain-containing protein [Croceibacterium sp.]